MKGLLLWLLCFIMAAPVVVGITYNVTGWITAGSGADLATVGTVTWTTPGNIVTCGDSNRATVSIGPSASTVIEQYVYVVKSGVIQTTQNKSNTTNWPSAVAYGYYGNLTDLWGVSWSPSDLSNITTGVVIAIRNSTSGATTPLSHYLNASNFSFGIPSYANLTIVGVQADAQRYKPTSSSTARVDCIQMQVNYSYNAPPTVANVKANYTGTTLIGNCTATTDGTKAHFNYQWWRYNSLNSSGTYTTDTNSGVEVNIANVTSPAGGSWVFSCQVNDTLNQTSAWTNSSAAAVSHPPTVGSVILNSTQRMNTTQENFTAWPQSVTDPNNDPVNFLYDWRLNGTSIAVLNMNFDVKDSAGTNKTKDYSTFSNNGTIIGATWNATGGWNGTGAYYFSGSSQYINFTNASGVPIGNDNYTIEAWIKPTSGGSYGIVGWGNFGSNSQANALRMNGATQLMNYWWGNDLTVDTPDLTDGNWHHAVAEFDGTTRSIWVDGVLRDSDQPSGHNVPNSTNFRIGVTSGGEYFPGTIDEVRVYNRSLSGAEIIAHYNNRTNLMAGQDLRVGENWTACVIPNDGGNDGNATCSNGIIVQTSVPSVASVILNSTLGTNTTQENLTAWPQSVTDPNNDTVNLVYDWRLNGTSIALVNMNFDVNNSAGNSTTRDFTTYNHSGVASAMTWNATGGWNGSGAYEHTCWNGATIPDDASFNVSTITLAAWVKPTTYSQYCSFFSKQDWNGSEWIGLIVASFLPGLDIQVNYRTTDGWNYLSTAVMPPDQWLHFVFTYNGSTGIIYINGVVNASQNTTGTPLWSNSNSTVIIHGMNGTMDNAMIFNRALSAAQVKALYENKTNILVSNETAVGNKWAACVTPNDGNSDGNTTCSGNLTINGIGWLGVNLSAPPDNTSVDPNATFYANATVTCNGDAGATCGSITATARYNKNSASPDTAINTTAGATPLQTPTNPQTNSSIMMQGQSWNVSWLVNATGANYTQYYIDALFNSSHPAVQPNDTTNARVCIGGCLSLPVISNASINASSPANINTTVRVNASINFTNPFSAVNLQVTPPTGAAYNTTPLLNKSWYNASWPYRKRITLNSSQINGTLSDFPVLVRLASDSDLSSRAQSSGNDILFTAPDGTTKLDHEIDLYNSTGGQLVAWVRIPTFANVTNNTIYMYYGNSTVASQQNASGVWTNGYDSVFHLSNNNGSVNGVNGTNSGTVTVASNCLFSKCYNMTGSLAAMNIAGPSSKSTFTISAWVNATVVNSEDWWYEDPADVDIGIRGSVASLYDGGYYDGSTALSTNTWYYFVFTQNATNATMYINATKETAITHRFSSLDIRGAIGYDLYSDYGLQGQIDEFRASTVERSAQWVQTEYNNQRPSSTFTSMGTEENAYSSGEYYNSSIVLNATGQWVFTFYANDTLGGNAVPATASDGLGNQYILVAFPLNIGFTSPTENDGATITTNWTVVNISVNSSVLQEVKLDWNGTNYTFFNSSLVAAYAFENRSALGENSTFVRDLSGYGNNANCSVGSCPSWKGTIGKYGGAYNYTGSQHLIINHSSSLPTNQITVSAWVKLTSASSSWETLAMEKDSGSWFYWLLYARASDSSPAYYPAFRLSYGDDVGADGTGILQAGEWTHLLGTYNGTHVTFYQNGVQGESTSYTTAGGTNNQAIWVGGNEVWGENMDGIIDDFRIWNTSVTAAQARFIYESTMDKYANDTWSYSVNRTNLTFGNYSYQAFGADSVHTVNTTRRTLTYTNAPFISSVILNSSSGTNTTSENLTAYPQGVTNTNSTIYDWLVNGTSIAVVNMNFDVNNSAGTNKTRDYSMFGNNATVNGSRWEATSGQNNTGTYWLDGINDYLVSADASSLNYGSAFTIWTRFKTPSPGWKWLVTKPSGSWFGIDSYGNLTWTRVGGQDYHSTKNVSDDVWHDGAVTFDNGALNLYVDGTNHGSWTGVTLAVTTGATYIGHRGDYVEYYNGYIDEVRIFNRSISATQIQALSNNRTDRIVSQELAVGNNWTACATPNNGNADGSTVCSNSLIISSGGACTYSGSGNWLVQGADSCVITTIIDLSLKNLTCNGTGTLKVRTNITNYTVASAQGGCNVSAELGGQLRR